MKQLLFYCIFLSLELVAIPQSKQKQTSTADSRKPVEQVITDAFRSKSDSATSKEKSSLHKKLILAKDTLIFSDYMMSIDRVNDNLNSISDSSSLGFEVVSMGRKIDGITDDISIIRKNLRGRSSAFNIKNLYLYQSFAKKLVRLERKWDRSDSITKANVDTLNALKVKIADNAVNLSNMLNMMDTRLDRADKQLFGQEVNYLWQKTQQVTIVNATSKVVLTKIGSEKNAIVYYFNQTSRQRAFVVILGIMLFAWLFVNRKLLKTAKEPAGSLDFLHLSYLNKYPVLSILVLLMSMMPFFEAYAPTSYIAIEYILLLIFSSVIFFRKENLNFRIGWTILVILFIVDTLTYLFMEPAFIARLWLLAVHSGIVVFSFLFYKRLDKNMPGYNWIKRAAVIAMILAVLGILTNLFGRFSLSGIFGISAIFALTQAVVLPVALSL